MDNREHLYVEKYRNSGGGGTASSITYDDSQTHLGASNVQQAIEALSARSVVAEYVAVNENLIFN